MNAIYHCLGILSFWTMACALSYLAANELWESDWFGPIKRRFKHLRLALQLPFTKEKAQYSRTAARYYINTARATKWDWWERNILANVLKRARKVGFTS